jgi:hypothetical protein
MTNYSLRFLAGVWDIFLSHYVYLSSQVNTPNYPMHAIFISNVEAGDVDVLFSARLIWRRCPGSSEIKLHFAQAYIILCSLSSLFKDAASSETI